MALTKITGEGVGDLDTLTVDGDVTLNDGSPNLRLKDTDTNRFVDLLYGTRVATFRNTMASGEDMDTVEPSMVFSFKDDSETRTALTIDHDANLIASGKVGIGTSSPAALLTMVAADGVMADQYVAKFTNSEATAGQNYGVFVAGGSTSADESFSVRKFDNSTTYFKVRGDGSTFFNCTSAPSASVVGSGFIKSAYDSELFMSGSLTTGNDLIHFFNPNGKVGSIATNGSATAYNTSSDYRLKENVTYDWDATTRLKQLKPARFNFIVDANTTVDGFLAHEAAIVCPESVSGSKDEVDADGNPIMQGIDQSKLVPLLCKTILELEARITALETA